MPKTHTGASSGVDYTIPALSDTRDIEVAFQGFADSLPAAPVKMDTQPLTASGPASLNVLYISEGAAAITLTLPATASDGDKIAVAQVGAGIITLTGIGAGVPVTAGPNTAVTAVWDGAKWVGLPFAFSGARPVESQGGDVVDHGAFRYHIFRTSGTFTSHKALTLDVLVVAGGSGGDTATPGAGGQVVIGQVGVGDWTFTPVTVGQGGLAPAGAGTDSSLSTVAASAAAASTPVALDADWAAVLNEVEVGGPGPIAGPAEPTTFGIGGSGGFQMLPSYVQEQESYSYTVGGSYSYDCSRPARAFQAQVGETEHRGDTRPVYCPDGWRVSLVDHAFVQCQNIADPSKVAMNGWMGGCPGGWYPCGMNCCTKVPIYETQHTCDGDGILSGTTCVRTCWGDNTQVVTGTRPKPCNAGFTAANGMCVDARPAGSGKGGDGLVALRYPHP